MPDTNNNATADYHQVTGGESDGEQDQYPDRPEQPDCIYYLRNGVCGYGSKCRYNHPIAWRGQGALYRDELPQREGQPDCQFFLRTGTCKFGPTCKYHHPQERNNGPPSEMNALGLPMRKDEKSCPYYMRTGSCKFGVGCKFNHPQPASSETNFTVTGPSVYEYTASPIISTGTPVMGPVSPLVLARNHPHMQGFPSYWPVAFPSGNIHMQQGWSTYMGNVNITAAEAVVPNYVYETHGAAGSSMPVSFPDRPDKPECQHYMKTGNCKYGASCKYHHPKERSQADAYTLGSFGLPIRPGQPICTFYSTYGSCKYGLACKFNHPLIGYYNCAPPFVLPESLPPFTNQRTSQVMLTLTENSSSRTVKPPRYIMKKESNNELKEPENGGSNNMLMQTCPPHASNSDSSHN